MKNSLKKSVTMKDVAERAGVSVATVSRAINEDGYVSLQTKMKVQQAIQELGYKPDATARSLKLRRTNTVGLMIADITNPFYSYLADGALSAARSTGYHVILSAHDEDPAMERESLEVLTENRVDGILAVPTGRNLKLWREIVASGTSVVLVDREIQGLPEPDVVLVDNVKGAFEAVSYLIELGHRRIGIISGPAWTTSGKGRLQGYRDALSRADLPADDALIHVGSFKRESGHAAVYNLLALSSPPTAIFAANNALGEAAMFAIREHGLRIPDDISLVIFDDVPWASLTVPRLTVVSQPTDSLGTIGLERLIQRLRAGQRQKQVALKTVLQPRLIVRESCAPPGRSGD